MLEIAPKAPMAKAALTMASRRVGIWRIAAGFRGWFTTPRMGWICALDWRAVCTHGNTESADNPENIGPLKEVRVMASRLAIGGLITSKTKYPATCRTRLQVKGRAAAKPCVRDTLHPAFRASDRGPDEFWHRQIGTFQNASKYFSHLLAVRVVNTHLRD